MTDPAGEQRVEEIERDLSIPWADVAYTPKGASPHALLNHVQAECPHAACRFHAAQLRLPDHARFLLARLRAVEEERDRVRFLEQHGATEIACAVDGRLDAARAEVERLKEVVAGAHALRCDCTGPGTLRDSRCVELQNEVA